MLNKILLEDIKMKFKLLLVVFGSMFIKDAFAVCDSEINTYLDEYIAIAHDPVMREFRDKEIQKELQSIASNDKQGIEKIINGSYGWQAENGEEQSSYTRFSKCLVTTAQERLNNLKGINNSNGIQATSIEQTRLSTQAHKDAFNQERQNSDSESAGDSNAKFISVPKVTQCMKLVDVRPMDTKDGYNKVDGRWYYW